MHSAQELATHAEALASLPSVYLRIREELDSPEGSITEVARIVAGDPALTASLLKVVNSALYSYGRKIESVQRAVTLLGLQHVHDLVLALSLGSALGEIAPQHLDLHRYWRDSVMCGLAARDIGQHCKVAAPDRLFVIGLLADIGHLVLHQIVPALAAEARHKADTEGIALFEAEQQIIGCDYAEVGAALLERWRLPPCFPGAVGAQRQPRLAGEFSLEAAIVNLATHIVAAGHLGQSSEEAAADVSPVVWSQVGLPRSILGELRETAELNLTGYVNLFFPSLRSA